jgi:hypothetical protein
MIQLADITKQAIKHYEKWLAAITTDAQAPYVPLTITRIGDTADTGTHRAQTLEEISLWQKSVKRPHGLSIQLLTPSARSKKFESKISAIRIDTSDDLLRFLDKYAEYEAFKASLQEIKNAVPSLTEWCTNHVRDIIKYKDEWPQLLEILTYFQQNPEPSLPIKLLPLQLSHSKFFEKHNQIICSLLDEVIMPERIKLNETSCARRYQLPEHPPMLTCFWNDEKIKAQFHGYSSLAFAIDELAAIPLPSNIMIITENRTSAYQLLSFPLPDTCVIFGTGYGAELLNKLNWLKTKEIWYWGDLDTHGLHIYGKLKLHFPQLESLMMDMETLDAHKAFQTKGEPFRYKTTNLFQPEEEQVFQYLMTHTLRLEQERVALTWIEAYLSNRVFKKKPHTSIG